MGYPVRVYQGFLPRSPDSADDVLDRLFDEASGARPSRRVQRFARALERRWPARTEAEHLAGPWHDMTPTESVFGKVCDMEVNSEDAAHMVSLIARAARRYGLICVDAGGTGVYGWWSVPPLAHS
ncbi:hypothetical protein [Demequina sediminicola]|uniref:hypothetical protein n=1 Tax=Demequina sediminicola TaxID=1095026 RepID=UPI0007865C46|nr:hypothetical protein [Demequina sediminicola]